MQAAPDLTQLMRDPHSVSEHLMQEGGKKEDALVQLIWGYLLSLAVSLTTERKQRFNVGLSPFSKIQKHLVMNVPLNTNRTSTSMLQT